MRTDANDTVEVKRATLYEEVWSVPQALLDPRCGLSDVGLAKLCDRWLIPRPRVGVGKRLKNPPPLLQKAAKAFAHSKPDRMHGLVSPGPGHLAIRVTPALERRALRVFDASAKAIEELK